ncbi:MAG: type II toxin-antitoxin system RelE/ParE family toxin [Patescibacteria group bacterium]
MSWDILFIKNSRGDEIVKDQIRALQKSTIAKIVHHIDLLKEQGPILPMPYSKKIIDNIYELRIRGNQEIRIFYTFNKKQIYFLHLFQKKSQKTPPKELKIAIDRFNVLTTI